MSMRSFRSMRSRMSMRSSRWGGGVDGVEEDDEGGVGNQIADGATNLPGNGVDDVSRDEGMNPGSSGGRTSKVGLGNVEDSIRQRYRHSSVPNSFNTRATTSRLNRFRSRFSNIKDGVAAPMSLRQSSILPNLKLEKLLQVFPVMLRFPPSIVASSPTPTASSGRTALERSEPQPALILVNSQTTFPALLSKIREVVEKELFHVFGPSSDNITYEVSAYFYEEVHTWKRRLRVTNAEELRRVLMYMENSRWRRNDWFEVEFKIGRIAEERAREYAAVINGSSSSVYSRNTDGNTDAETLADRGHDAEVMGSSLGF